LKSFHDVLLRRREGGGFVNGYVDHRYLACSMLSHVISGVSVAGDILRKKQRLGMMALVITPSVGTEEAPIPKCRALLNCFHH